MDPIIIVAFAALAAVLAVVLICEAVRLAGAFRALRRAQEEANGDPLNEVISVKQGADEVRIAFNAEAEGDTCPDGAEKNAGARSAEEEVAAAQALPQEPSAGHDAAKETAPEEAGESVFVPRAEKLTFAERYEQLEAEPKALLDEFTAYVVAMEECTKRLQTNALAFRYRKGQIAKAAIRRGGVVLNFSIANPSLNRMVRSERIKGVRMQPIELRLSSREDLELAKQTAEMTVGYLKGEEEYRTEKRKEARREAARQRREAANDREEADDES